MIKIIGWVLVWTSILQLGYIATRTQAAKELTEQDKEGTCYVQKGC